MSSRIAIVPARGGSKRIPRKNIRDFCGKPVVAYSIEVALSSNLFDEVMVSTDDSEIAGIAKHYGATVPFLRSPQTSDDNSGIDEVLIEVLRQYQETGRQFQQVCCILPTAPLILVSDLEKAFSLLVKGRYDSTFPVVRFSYPIQRALKRDGEATTMIWPENYTARSQDLMPAYHDCGQFYWLTTKQFIKYRRVCTDNFGTIEIPETRAQDMDTDEDWRICELKYSIKTQ